MTSGDIGINAMHPPGKRSMRVNINIYIYIYIYIYKTVSRHAGGRSGPPLRGGFSSIRGIN